MSVLSLPRFVFQGTTSWNPNTVNNSPDTYDENAPSPQFHPTGFPPGNPPPITADNYETWIKTYLAALGTAPGSWNVYGDQACSFVNAAVTGIQLASGPASQDPLLGKLVQMVGQSYFPSDTPPSRMVDIDPFSPYTTQIFYHSIRLGDDTVGVSGPGVVRMFSRWPNMARNLNQTGTLIIAGGMGVTWQATVAADQLVWHGVEQSPALAALQAAIAQGGNQGLEIRFSSYRTLYFTEATYNGQQLSNQELLSQAYLDGFTGGNPAVSVALGTIGVWGAGELSSAPTDRALLPGAAVSTAATPVAKTRAAQESAKAKKEAAVSVQLGTAFARVDAARCVVTLDFLGTFPEQDASLTKADVGTFELQAIDPSTGQPVTIGQPLAYDRYARAPYEAGSGIVDFSFEPVQESLVRNGLLQLVQTGSNAVALQESALLAETDQRGVSVDQGQTEQVTIQVYQRGVTPPSGGVEILLATYDEGLNNVPPASSILELLDAQGNPLPDPPVLQVGANGSATFGIQSRSAGNATVFFLPYPAGGPQPTPPDVGSMVQIPDSYVTVRALAFDNALFNKPDSELTWDFIYREVLQTYNLVYPLMSLIINLGDETAVNQNARKIELATSLKLFLTTLFMPVTREMSAGKRDVLDRYLKMQP